MKEEYFKDYDAWNKRIKALDAKPFNDYCHEREIWWCALGVNVGSEQDGKSESFERPVVIVRKIRKDLLIIVPLTSKIGDFEDRITACILGQRSQILLSQVRTISSRRLLRNIGYLKFSVFHQTIIGLLRLIISLPGNPVRGSLGASEVRG